MGHDLDAALTMGEFRHLLRAHAPESSGPAELCDTVNRLFRTVVEGNQMATAVVAFIDPATGDVSVVSAGHPPWLLLDPDGPVRVSSDDPCLPLGASFLAQECTSSEFTLTPGSTLIFYTDGLIESRHEALDISIAKLAERCSGLGYSTLDAALDFLVDSSLEATSSRDDVAVLAVTKVSELIRRFRRPPRPRRTSWSAGPPVPGEYDRLDLHRSRSTAFDRLRIDEDH